jgi:hypothetical protein
MDRVYLIGIVSGFVNKDKCQRKIVGVIDNGTARFGRCANVHRRYFVYTPDRFKSGAKGTVVIPVFGMLKPEEYSMNKHGRL